MDRKENEWWSGRRKEEWVEDKDRGRKETEEDESNWNVIQLKKEDLSFSHSPLPQSKNFLSLPQSDHQGFRAQKIHPRMCFSFMTFGFSLQENQITSPSSKSPWMKPPSREREWKENGWKIISYHNQQFKPISLLIHFSLSLSLFVSLLCLSTHIPMSIKYESEAIFQWLNHFTP